MQDDLHMLVDFLKEASLSVQSDSNQKKKPDVNVSDFAEDLSVSVSSRATKKKRNKSKGFDVQKFEFLLRSKLIDEYKKACAIDRPYVSVSEICSCIRKCYYERKKYSVDINELFKFPYLALLQEVGIFVHKFIQSLYGFNESEKTVISEKYKVKGRVDCIQDNVLIEIKTVDPVDFNDKYSVDDYNQALVYAYILNSEYSYKIDHITLLYVMRSFRRIVTFDLETDEKVAVSLLERSSLLLSSIHKNVVPDPIGSTREQCSSCFYKKYCEKDSSFVKKPYDIKTVITNENVEFCDEKDAFESEPAVILL